MDSAMFRDELRSVPALRTLLLRFALFHHRQVARMALCNRTREVRPDPLRAGPHPGHRPARSRRCLLRVLRCGPAGP
jgi:hypothetical protein